MCCYSNVVNEIPVICIRVKANLVDLLVARCSNCLNVSKGIVWLTILRDNVVFNCKVRCGSIGVGNSCCAVTVCCVDSKLYLVNGMN